MGGDSVNGGVIVIPRTGTYDYVLQSGCVGFYELRVQSDSGLSEWFPKADSLGFPQKGQVALSAGSWRGQWFVRSSLISEPCTWAITLTGPD